MAMSGIEWAIFRYLISHSISRKAQDLTVHHEFPYLLLINLNDHIKPNKVFTCSKMKPVLWCATKSRRG